MINNFLTGWKQLAVWFSSDIELTVDSLKYKHMLYPVVPTVVFYYALLLVSIVIHWAFLSAVVSKTFVLWFPLIIIFIYYSKFETINNGFIDFWNKDV